MLVNQRYFSLDVFRGATDADGSIYKVDFYNGTSSHVSVTVNNVPVNIPPVVSITAPANKRPAKTEEVML